MAKSAQPRASVKSAPTSRAKTSSASTAATVVEAKFHHAVLANGLHVVAETHPRMQSAAMGFYVAAGARDETAELSGVSHFLEHMVFKGTDRRTADDVNREFDDMGAYCNAYTSDEVTGYYAYLLPEHLEKAVALWADVLRPALRNDDFEKEKQVILEEILMYQDSPPYGGEDLVKSLYFGDHPLAKCVMGTVESVSALTPEQMRAYHQLRYSPGNVVLAACGKVDFDALVGWAEKYCGHWEPAASSRRLEQPKIHPEFRVLEKANSAQQYTVLLADSPSSLDASRCAARLLSVIVGDDSGSRLYWELVDSGLAETAVLASSEFQDCGCFMTYLCCTPSRTSELLQRVFNIYRQVEVHGVTPEELEQARSKVRSHLVFRSEKPSGRLSSVAANWMYRREYQSLADDLGRLDRLTIDDLHSMLRCHPLTIGAAVSVGPKTNITQPK